MLRGVSLERNAARQHFVEDDPQRINIRPLIRLFALHLLGRHVFRRPDHHPSARDPFASERPGDPEVHDPGVPVLVDHDVLRLEVPVDDPQTMGLGQSLAELLGDRDGPAYAERARLADEPLQVLARNILHGDEGRALGPAQVEHPADVAVTDLPGEFQLVRETLDRLPIEGDLRLEELEGDLLLDVGVVDLVDASHAAVAQFLDDLVAAGESGARGEFVDGCLKSLRYVRKMALRRRKLGAALSAEFQGIWIVGMAGRALVGQTNPLL